MKYKILFLLFVVSLFSTAQKSTIQSIDDKVKESKADKNLMFSEFDWCKLRGITTDGGGILNVWSKKNKIIKIYQEIGLSYGRLRTTIYFENQQPIQIIEIEDNFGHKNDEINYQELNQVFERVVYIFDWNLDEGKSIEKGERNYSEMSCSYYELAEPIMKLAEKALSN